MVEGHSIGGGTRRLAEALVIAAVSPALPGLAYLRAGRVRLGAGLLGAQALLVVGAALAVAQGRSLFMELSVRPGWLLAVSGGGVLLAGLWAVLIIHSYALLVPDGLSPLWRLAGGTTVSVLCLLVVVPPLTVAHYGYLQRDLVESLFAEEPGRGAAGPASGAPDARDPWAGMSRLNVLLIGGDADVDRPGVRTDSMTVASVDTRTGDTLLLSLPRNLQHVPVWSGTERVPFPPEGLLNAVYGDGIRRPGVLAGGGHVENPGAELLKRTVAHILGRPVPYYAMVDMRSFRQIVDAVGGVRVCVAEAVPVPRQQVPAGVLRPGCRRLSGREALWYGRSRTGSSDYARMSRQKCLMWALARQAGPLTVLRSFQRLTTVFKDSVNTDLPQRLLPPLVDLAAKIRNAEITSLQFVPPLISTWRPDYHKIRKLTTLAVRDSASGTRETRGLHILSNSCT
ncbi:LytR family transcriptional attenuator [Actinomadura pelletieri DSM 43383]|uniref:LytR family transcriptional attenuator n=1 Tax=Actinomadura pelletieri DSM 43383 TaxID=1120940 RepID=A0A495Q9J6_9ACTN|nr:LCP family protein [Actinomadura pelletieri]RKS67756.1 LytR family transcriptional attenuator [Actinomadura pelletieri DSM 43383]